MFLRTVQEIILCASIFLNLVISKGMLNFNVFTVMALIGVALITSGKSTADEKKSPQTEVPAKSSSTSASDPDSLSSPAKETGQEGMKAFLRGDWTEAHKAFLESLKINPENTRTLANLGATSLQLERFDDACDYLERALKDKPDLHSARVTLGLAYFRAEKIYQAISTLTQAVADRPSDARAHNYLAVTVLEKGWVLAAEKEFQEALSADPGFADAHYNLALIYMDRKPPAFELAHRHYQRAVDLGALSDPKLAEEINSMRRK